MRQQPTVNPSDWSVGTVDKKELIRAGINIDIQLDSLEVGKLGSNKNAVRLFKLDP